MLIITAMAIWVIGIHVVGSLWVVLAAGLTIAVTSVVMGLMASSLARTPMQVIQLMLALVTPQILLSGVFNLAGAPRVLEWISLALPLRHGVDALKAVMTMGSGITDIATQLGILWAMIALFFTVAALGMRKKRAR